MCCLCNVVRLFLMITVVRFGASFLLGSFAGTVCVHVSACLCVFSYLCIFLSASSSLRLFFFYLNIYCKCFLMTTKFYLWLHHFFLAFSFLFDSVVATRENRPLAECVVSACGKLHAAFIVGEVYGECYFARFHVHLRGRHRSRLILPQCFCFFVLHLFLALLN